MKRLLFVIILAGAVAGATDRAEKIIKSTRLSAATVAVSCAVGQPAAKQEGDVLIVSCR